MTDLESLCTALTSTVGVTFKPYAWVDHPDEFGVAAYDGGNDLAAGNVHAEESMSGTIDLFIKSTEKTRPESVASTLDALDVAWRLNSVQYENKTGYVHWEWVFET